MPKVTSFFFEKPCSFLWARRPTGARPQNALVAAKLPAARWRCLAWPKHPAFLRAHAGIASGFLPGQRGAGTARRGYGKVQTSQQEAQKAQDRRRFHVKLCLYCILSLHFVWKFNGFPRVLWISCGEQNFCYISRVMVGLRFRCCICYFLIYFAVFFPSNERMLYL